MTRYALGSSSPPGKIHIRLIGKELVFFRTYSKHILNDPHVPPLSWNTPNIINIDDHKVI
jgi:hypothetical protein